MFDGVLEDNLKGASSFFVISNSMGTLLIGVLSPLSIIGDLSVFFFGFCFEKFFHRPCVTYGKSENRMP